MLKKAISIVTSITMCFIFAVNCVATDSTACEDNAYDFDLSTVYFEYDNIISVGSIDSYGNYASSSNWDITHIDLAAPVMIFTVQ